MNEIVIQAVIVEDKGSEAINALSYLRNLSDTGWTQLRKKLNEIFRIRQFLKGQILG